jgi:hypothetical protein
MFLFLVQVDTLRLRPGRTIRLLPDSRLAKTIYKLDFVDSTLCSFMVGHSINPADIADLCPYQYLAGDAVVVWRAWALWRGHRICLLPIALWVLAVGESQV